MSRSRELELQPELRVGRAAEPDRWGGAALPRGASLPEVAAERLRDAIIGGSLAAGERLREVDIARRLRISRTPLRQAIHMLEAEGLVERIARVGTFVRPISVDEVDDVYRVKAVLQVLGAELAAGRMTAEQQAELGFVLGQMEAAVEQRKREAYVALVDRFHELLLRAAQSPTLTALYRTLEPRIRRYRHFVLAQPGREIDSYEEHRLIGQRLMARDVAGAGQAMQAHASSARAFVRQRVESLASGVAARVPSKPPG